jgi:hypothetical protein
MLKRIQSDYRSYASSLQLFIALTVRLLLQPAPKPAKRIIKLVHHAFFQRNDSVIGNLNVFRTNFGAAFRDVAVTDPLSVSQVLQPIFGIERMHFQRGHVNQKTRPDEFVVHLMIAQHMANVLAEKTLDALPKFLNAIDVGLLHPPRPIRRIRRARTERLDSTLHQKIPRDVCDQVFQDRERLHRFDRDRPIERQIAHPRHTHQLWHPVHFGRARSTLAGLAIPSTGQVVCLGSLDLMDSVEHNHSFGAFGRVILKRPGVRVTAPDFENGGFQS